MSTQTVINQTRVEAFMGKVLADTSGMAVTIMASIGDRLGLFGCLTDGPVTSTQLAARAHVNERYTYEWLASMTSAGYLEHDPASGYFTLPAEHAPILAQENGPLFFGGLHQMLEGMSGQYQNVLQAFQQGGGVPQFAYSDDTWTGLERFTASWFENLLIPVWIPAMPVVRAKLEQGAEVADVGCGRGRALIKLAQAYPNAHYVGYDNFEPTIAQATANAQRAGVADRVRFRYLDASSGLPGTYDVITTFDVVHDAVNPHKLVRSIRQALRPDGRYVCVEVNCSDKLEENAGPLGALLYSISILYCMTTSLSQGGEGLGTVGLPEAKFRKLCAEAGFTATRRVPLENPFSSLYEITP